MTARVERDTGGEEQVDPRGARGGSAYTRSRDETEGDRRPVQPSMTGSFVFLYIHVDIYIFSLHRLCMQGRERQVPRLLPLLLWREREPEHKGSLDFRLERRRRGEKEHMHSRSERESERERESVGCKINMHAIPEKDFPSFVCLCVSVCLCTSISASLSVPSCLDRSLSLSLS